MEHHKKTKVTRPIRKEASSVPRSSETTNELVADAITNDSSPCTLHEYLFALAPEIWPREHCSSTPVPPWPVDVFAIAASVLDRSGAYATVANEWPPGGLSSVPDEADKDETSGTRVPPAKPWDVMIRDVGNEWRRLWFSTSVEQPDDWSPTPPPMIKAWWDVLCQESEIPIAAIGQQPRLCESLLNLLAASDEASYGLGTSEPLAASEFGGNESDGCSFDRMLLLSSFGLTSEDGESTLCRKIHPSRVRVLPKLRTPRFGVTLRSLSLNLALCPAGEVQLKWHLVGGGKEQRPFVNLLLVPWPDEILPSEFHESNPAFGRRNPCTPLFDYRPNRESSSADWIRNLDRLIKSANKIIGKIDGVIFPECSLEEREANVIFEHLGLKGILTIAGVRGRDKGTGLGSNSVRTRFPFTGPRNNSVAPSHKPFVEYRQDKHHRWLLDRSQIITYGLASQLHPEKDWWEGIAIGPRQLSFVALRPWLTSCVLICEDLARQDPIAEVIRSVGPSLVVALLMDGPQLKSRWPSRYATVLADDPGSSVLTLTSAGMVDLSRPVNTEKGKRIVALWKDSLYGAVELELPQGATGLVLTLTNSETRDRTADGRHDRRSQKSLVYGGSCPIYPSDPRPRSTANQSSTPLPKWVRRKV